MSKNEGRVVTIQDKTYMGVSNAASGGCTGCAGSNDSRVCNALGDCVGVIFKERENTFQKEFAELNSARTTLAGLGYTYEGGACWKPPLGPLRTFDQGRARSTDPATSQAAAVKVKAGPLRQRIEDRLRSQGNLTGTEMAQLLGARLNSVTPRFAELSRAGRIKDSGRVRDGQIVWQAV